MTRRASCPCPARRWHLRTCARSARPAPRVPRSLPRRWRRRRRSTATWWATTRGPAWLPAATSGRRPRTKASRRPSGPTCASGSRKDTLYIAVVCYDRTPSAIIASEARRDAPLDDSDSIRVILDTFHDQQNGFVFGTNPNALEYDGQVTNEGQGGSIVLGGAQAGSGGGFNLNWDASWTVRTSVTEIGWSAEFAIPFRTLRYPAGDTQQWGINFQRTIRRRNEVAYWSPLPRQFTLFRLSQAGTVVGLQIPAQRNLKLTPYALGRTSYTGRTSGESSASGDVGGDLKYSLTPSMTLDATINTDFAQVEVDEFQINLDRFNLFYPEKRPFFLENAGLFAVGSPAEVELFFSRRIGIGDDGEVIPIVGGARVSGQVHGSQRRAAQHADRFVRRRGRQQLHGGARPQGSAQPLQHRRHRRQSRGHRVAVGPRRLQPQLCRGRARGHRQVRVRVGLCCPHGDTGQRRRRGRLRGARGTRLARSAADVDLHVGRAGLQPRGRVPEPQRRVPQRRGAGLLPLSAHGLSRLAGDSTPHLVPRLLGPGRVPADRLRALRLALGMEERLRTAHRVQPDARRRLHAVRDLPRRDRATRHVRRTGNADRVVYAARQGGEPADDRRALAGSSAAIAWR